VSKSRGLGNYKQGDDINNYEKKECKQGNKTRVMKGKRKTFGCIGSFLNLNTISAKR
jgi:hypothetical protein